jgi:hypothetical protein
MLDTKGLFREQPQAGKNQMEVSKVFIESKHLNRSKKGNSSGTRRKGQRNLARGLVYCRLRAVSFIGEQ